MSDISTCTSKVLKSISSETIAEFSPTLGSTVRFSSRMPSDASKTTGDSILLTAESKTTGASTLVTEMSASRTTGTTAGASSLLRFSKPSQSWMPSFNCRARSWSMKPIFGCTDGLFCCTKRRAASALQRSSFMRWAMTTVALRDCPAWQCTKTAPSRRPSEMKDEQASKCLSKRAEALSSMATTSREHGSSPDGGMRRRCRWPTSFADKHTLKT
mmetsp:Transcript_84785/g.133941  ORF Transcript_84785/g.133941 Transcript_84785/m.133941 type:complete len:215 (+) Transcript_84785:467-1111(+)